MLFCAVLYISVLFFKLVNFTGRRLCWIRQLFSLQLVRICKYISCVKNKLKYILCWVCCLKYSVIKWYKAHLQPRYSIFWGQLTVPTDHFCPDCDYQNNILLKMNIHGIVEINCRLDVKLLAFLQLSSHILWVQNSMSETPNCYIYYDINWLIWGIWSISFSTDCFSLHQWKKILCGLCLLLIVFQVWNKDQN